MENPKKLPALSEIVQSGVLGKYFFSATTMRHWGQVLSDFKVEWHDKDTVKIHAPNNLGGITEEYIKVKDGNFKKVRVI